MTTTTQSAQCRVPAVAAAAPASVTVSASISVSERGAVLLRLPRYCHQSPLTGAAATGAARRPSVCPPSERLAGAAQVRERVAGQGRVEQPDLGRTFTGAPQVKCWATHTNYHWRRNTVSSSSQQSDGGSGLEGRKKTRVLSQRREEARRQKNIRRSQDGEQGLRWYYLNENG